MGFVRLDNASVVQESAPQMAQWIFESGPGFFVVLFGDQETAVTHLRRWVTRDTSEFSGLEATLASSGSERVGMFIGLSGEEIDRRRRADLLVLIQQTPAAERNALKAKLQEIAALAAPVSGDHYYIRTLAVDASQRGRGIGRQLLGRAIADARELGFSGIRLDVDSDNDVARRLYTRAGFASIYEGHAPGPGLHMHSMALTF